MEQHAEGGRDEEEAKELFVQLKPACVEVLRSFSTDSLSRLDAALRRLPRRLPPPLVEYVLFPLRTWLRRLQGSDRVLLEQLLSTISLVLARADPGHLAWDIFHELFVFLCMLLDRQMSEEAGFGAASEERTLQALRCLKSLLHSARDSSLSQLYQNVPAVGHCVSVMLAAVESWEAREVRSTALLDLLALSGLREEEAAAFTGGDIRDTTDSLRELQEKLGRDGERGGRGEVIASFLPGVTTAITKLLTSEPNLGQGVVNLGLLVWSRYVSLTLSDRLWEREDGEEEDYLSRALKLAEDVKAEPEATPTGHTPTGGRDLRVERSWRWRRETDKKLAVLVGKMGGVLVTGGGWRGRRGVVLWAHCLLGNCHRMLVTMVPVLLEALLSLSHDDYQQVSSPANLSLELISAQHAREGGGEVVSVLEERLYSLTSALPRLMRQHDDARKVSLLQLLAGYLKLLGPHTVTLTLSPPHLSHLIHALVQTLELEATPPHLQEVQSGPQGVGRGGGQNSGPQGSENEVPHDTGEWWSLSLHFKQFREPRVEQLIRDCCQLLGFLGSLPALLDHLLDRHHSAAAGGRGSELLVVIGYVLLGAGGRGCVRGREKPAHAVSRQELCELVGDVLDYMTGDGWERGRGGGGGGGGEGEESGVLLQCIQLQVVEVCVRLLGEAVSARLEGLCYQLLARAGSSNPHISLQALSSLSAVAAATGARSLSELISENVDYLVNSVSMALRSHTHSQIPLQVLQAVMDNGSQEVLPLMRDSIDELLLSLDLQLAANEGVWSVLRSLAAALHRWSPATKEDGEKGGGGGCYDNSNGGSEEEDFSGYFHDNHSVKTRGEASGGGEAEEREVEGETEDGGDLPLSPLEQAAVEVLERCPHYLPSSSSSLSPSLPLTVLDCLHHCLLSLSHNHRTLLPLVHKVWPSLLLRLSDPAHPVALRALELLWDLCEVCGDFVRKRVVKGVWPVIVQSLTRLAEGSRRCQDVYKFSVACKLQQKMLQTVSVLSTRLQDQMTGPLVSPSHLHLLLQASSSDLEPLVTACLPYLSHCQPPQLVQTCQTSFISLMNSDPDLVWLLLHQLVPMATKLPPHPSLTPYKFPPLTGAEEFADTVPSLLQLTHEYQ